MEAILEIMHKNVETAQKILKELAFKFQGRSNCKCESASQNAVVTDSKIIPAKLRDKLSILFG